MEAHNRNYRNANNDNDDENDVNGDDEEEVAPSNRNIPNNDGIDEVMEPEQDQTRQQHMSSSVASATTASTSQRPDSYLPLNAASSSKPVPTPSIDSVTHTAKRRAIQAIMRDKSLSDFDKRLRVQNLMDGRPAVPALPNASSVMNGIDEIMGKIGASGPSGAALVGGNGIISGGINLDNSVQEALNCIHYERNCWIIAPCCQKLVGCRICHDEMMTAPPTNRHSNGDGELNSTRKSVVCGPMDRFAIKEIVCRKCHTRQDSKTNECINCKIQFADYHCSICNLWMSTQNKPWHCESCGFCRVGGRDNFRHCDLCCMCISVNVYNSHNCMKDKYKNSCPVCREDMFSSRQSPQDLPCGHAIHAHCFRKLAKFDYRCPICKKTVVSASSMRATWESRAHDIARQPMPADLARVVTIICNDCEVRSENMNWHFLGVQCPGCNSFNTVLGDDTVANGGNGGSTERTNDDTNSGT